LNESAKISLFLVMLRLPERTYTSRMYTPG
jgi:hypothetical protein